MMRYPPHNINEPQHEKIEFLSPPSDYVMADEYYQFATIDHFWIKWRFEALRKILPKGYVWGRTLDIGCGNGVVREQIEKYYNSTVAGCDLNLSALRMAPLGCGPLYFYNIHQRHKEFKESFSTILLLDVLEHIKEPISFLNSVSFHLKVGGRLIINVPVFQWFYSRYDKVQGHVKRYNFLLLKSELRLSGFNIENATYWCMSLMFLLLIRKFIMRFCRKKQVMRIGFQPISPLIDYIMQFIRRIECVILPRPPAGTSLIVIARKERSSITESVSN